MTPTQERWAFADKLMKIHGDDVGAFVAERIRTLADQNDAEGTCFWIDISSKILSQAGPEEGSWTQ